MGLGTKLCFRHLSPCLAKGIPAQPQGNLCVVGERFGGVERVGERPGRGQEMRDEREEQEERQKEAELGQKQGWRSAELKRRLEHGASMERTILPPEINLLFF